MHNGMTDTAPKFEISRHYTVRPVVFIYGTGGWYFTKSNHQFERLSVWEESWRCFEYQYEIINERPKNSQINLWAQLVRRTETFSHSTVQRLVFVNGTSGNVFTEKRPMLLSREVWSKKRFVHRQPSSSLGGCRWNHRRIGFWYHARIIEKNHVVSVLLTAQNLLEFSWFHLLSAVFTFSEKKYTTEKPNLKKPIFSREQN